MCFVNREKEATRVIGKPSWTISYTPRCACDPEAKGAFVENPSLTAERASVLLAFKELAKVHPCDRNQDCSFVTQGEEYAGGSRRKDSSTRAFSIVLSGSLLHQYLGNMCGLLDRGMHNERNSFAWKQYQAVRHRFNSR